MFLSTLWEIPSPNWVHGMWHGSLFSSKQHTTSLCLSFSEQCLVMASFCASHTALCTLLPFRPPMKLELKVPAWMHFWASAS